LNASINIDIFFGEQVTPAMLEKLPDWLGFPVELSDWKIVEYKGSAGAAWYVSINPQSGAGRQVVNALWSNLRIPFIAYEGRYKDYHNCVRWSADANGIRQVDIVIAEDKH